MPSINQGRLFLLFLAIKTIFVDSAIIATVEYYPLQNATLSAEQRLLGNAHQYMELLEKSAAKNKIDLIVYPEMTLNTGNKISEIPANAYETLDQNAPCNSSAPYPAYIKLISCAAQTHNTSIVINTVEREKCPQNETSKSANCQKSGYLLYNTDLVFDTRGRVIAKYRKFNLFGEYELDKPETADLVTFETEFNQTFGIFTCFDILFQNPAQKLVENNVSKFIFPTMWFGSLPFLTGVQTQQMWAYAHNVLLISAGANNPKLRSGGTGVFQGNNQTIFEAIVTDYKSRVYLFDTDKGTSDVNDTETVDEISARMDIFGNVPDPSIVDFTSKLLNTSIPSNRVCHVAPSGEQFCCNATTTVTTNTTMATTNSYVYHLVAYQGLRDFSGTYVGGIEVCAILACVNQSVTSCGDRFPNFKDVSWPHRFEAIELYATFPNTKNRTQYPNTLKSSILPINARETQWVRNVNNNITTIEFTTRTPQDRLMTFAIYGRDFDKDFDPNNGALGISGGAIFIVIAFVNIINMLY